MGAKSPTLGGRNARFWQANDSVTAKSRYSPDSSNGKDEDLTFAIALSAVGIGAGSGAGRDC